MVTSPAPPCLVTPAATVSCRRQRQPQRQPRPRVIQATAKASKAKARLVQRPVARCPVHTTGLQPPRPSFHISTRPTVTAGNSLKSRPQTPNKGLRGCHYHRTSIHAHLQCPTCSVSKTASPSHKRPRQHQDTPLQMGRVIPASSLSSTLLPPSSQGRTAPRVTGLTRATLGTAPLGQREPLTCPHTGADTPHHTLVNTPVHSSTQVPAVPPAPSSKRSEKLWAGPCRLPPLEAAGSTVPRSDPTASPSSGSHGRAPPHTFGNSCSSSFKTRSRVPGTSSGPTARRECSNWLTRKQCRDFGGCTKTNQI